MRIEDLRYFVRVAEAGSISQAAQDHYITQQGLSRIISSLENELGVKLLRRGKNLSLTPAGEAVLDEAKNIESSYMRMLESANRINYRWRDTQSSIYTIYATSVLCTTLVPHIITRLTQKYPGLFFNVLEKLGLDITDDMVRDEDHSPNSVAIVSLADFLEQESAAMQAGTLNYEPLFTDTLCIAVAADSPLAGRDMITVDELRSLPMVIHNSEMLMAQRILGESYQLNSITHTTNHPMCRNMIAKGLAVGLTSDLIQYVYRNDSIVQVPLDRKITLKYGIVRWDNEAPFVEEIVSVIRDEFHKVAAAVAKA